MLKCNNKYETKSFCTTWIYENNILYHIGVYFINENHVCYIYSTYLLHGHFFIRWSRTCDKTLRYIVKFDDFFYYIKCLVFLKL